MLNYTYIDNQEGGKTLLINKDNDIVIMNLHEDVEGHKELINFLKNDDKIEKYVLYLSSNPNRPFVLEEILSL